MHHQHILPDNILLLYIEEMALKEAVEGGRLGWSYIISNLLLFQHLISSCYSQYGLPTHYNNMND